MDRVAVFSTFYEYKDAEKRTNTCNICSSHPHILNLFFFFKNSRGGMHFAKEHRFQHNFFKILNLKTNQYSTQLLKYQVSIYLLILYSALPQMFHRIKSTVQ